MSVISQSFTPASQLLARNLDQLENRSVIIAGAVEDPFISTLTTDCQQIQLWCTDYRMFRHYQPQSLSHFQVSFSESFSGQQADCLVLYMPKAKEEARYLLASVMPYLSDNAQIIMVGENKGGISGAPSLLAPYSEQCIKRDGARRCSLYQATLSKPVPAFDIDKWYKEFTLKIDERTITVRSLPGVFSHGRLDMGTELLLKTVQSAPKKMAGRLLDFGCGAGIIATFFSRQYPQLQPELVDINALALASSRETLKANQIDGKVYPSDVYSDIEGRFEVILSNPPFHAGRNTHYLSTEQFLEKAGQHLTPTGQLTIVANRFLKYEPFINKGLPHCKVLLDNSQFKIFQAHR